MSGQSQPVAEGLPSAALETGHEMILVVEDDRMVRDYVIAQLHSLGYIALPAADAAAALAIIDGGDTVQTQLQSQGATQGGTQEATQGGTK